ncbi:ATP-dependent Clp protease proteolytic subunit-related protein 4, chloroplastic-like [Zingiber officinale]|uniref:ATP-dependent Clp protease proteolytic subunit-related protein 4, chloroplastic-like n=1 Tax=Zingiber officinale TaxID=94328 RepID=UPI001C4AE1BD|nr:ATP-dependent Clp protease proteolytic subunit-related protein 4, chloroplastic-like [Zingiber officinale]XP_042418897.1 ATP-dependent Clp protease proteolytic subunit-related protein 4, chloroplastic-like [Zingiber officinale]
MEIALFSPRTIPADACRVLSISPRSSWSSGRSAPRASVSASSFSSASSRPSSLSCSLVATPFLGGGSVHSDFNGLRVPSLKLPTLPHARRPMRGVVTMVIPFLRGTAWEQPPPDLASYLYKNRIVYLGMCLVPAVTELMMAEFLYLQYEDAKKPIYLYINSTGTTKGGEKLGYETEAFAIYDVMRYIKTPIFTLCVGNAWGEAALLLAAGAKGNRSALPSSTIMIRQPIARFQGQASDVDIARKEISNVKAELVGLYSRHIGKSREQIEEDIRRPKYFSPSEAVEYGIIDKVLYNEKRQEDQSVISDLKKGQLS